MPADFSVLSLLPLFIIIATGMLLSITLKKLTVAGAVMGGLVSICIFAGAGYPGICMMAVFFFTGIIVTGWQIDVKQQSGLAETNKGRRTAGQVLANAGAPALLGLLPYYDIIAVVPAGLLIAACFASATADTMSSELGNVYGKRFYNILSFRKDQRGLNGVVSVEGTLFGLLGSFFITIVYVIGFGWTIQALIIVIAGAAGNIMDSLLGATLERKNYLNNNAVNFLNTCFAAVVAYALYCVSFDFV